MESLNNLLDKELEAIRMHLSALDALVRGLNPAQLAWQPQPEKWSIAQCIGHLNRAMAPYLREMEKEIPKAIRSGQQPRPDFRSGFWGKRLPRMFAPKPSGRIKWKMKTMKTFQVQVSAGQVEAEIALFRDNLANLSRLVEAAREVDLGRTRIVSAISKMLKFKLGDAIRFVNAHNERHLLQANNVRKMLPSLQGRGQVRNASPAET